MKPDLDYTTLAYVRHRLAGIASNLRGLSEKNEKIIKGEEVKTSLSKEKIAEVLTRDSRALTDFLIEMGKEME